MTDSENERRPLRATAVAGAFLTVAIAGWAAVAPGPAAPAAGPEPAIEVASTPTVQTVATKVVAQAGRPKVAFGTAKFTITVRNSGPGRLFDVTVTDPRSPACDRTFGSLAAGASTAYSCSAASVAQSYKNVVTASGHRSGGGRDLARADATAKATAASLVLVRAKVTSSTGVPLFTG
jgi:hypothetical protein